MPDRSTFSKNRHGRFADGEIMRRLFESVVEKCVAFGFVGGTDAAVDGSTIEADANRERKGTPQEVEKIWSHKEQVQRPVAEFLAKMAENDLPAQPGPKHKPPKYISETDPDAAWSLKDGPGRFSYETNYLIDTDHGIIVDGEPTATQKGRDAVRPSETTPRPKTPPAQRSKRSQRRIPPRSNRPEPKTYGQNGSELRSEAPIVPPAKNNAFDREDSGLGKLTPAKHNI